MSNTATHELKEHGQHYSYVSFYNKQRKTATDRKKTDRLYRALKPRQKRHSGHGVDNDDGGDFNAFVCVCTFEPRRDSAGRSSLANDSIGADSGITCCATSTKCSWCSFIGLVGKWFDGDGYVVLAMSGTITTKIWWFVSNTTKCTGGDGEKCR